MVSTLYIELSELVLCGSDLVWVFIDSLQMLNHIIRVIVQINSFAPEIGGDMLPDLAIILTSYIGTIQLGRVVIIMVGIQLLSH